MLNMHECHASGEGPAGTSAVQPALEFEKFDPRHVFWNLGTAALYEEAVRRGEASLTTDGALSAVTVPHTGRSPNDKFIVDEPSSRDRIGWGPVNRPMREESFSALERDIRDYLGGRDVFVQECRAG